jgi:hypothetical protein
MQNSTCNLKNVLYAQLHSHIVAKLLELPLNKAQANIIANTMMENEILLKAFQHSSPDGATFDFSKKVMEIVSRFAPNGLTINTYLKAIVKHIRAASELAVFEQSFFVHFDDETQMRINRFR